MFVNTTRLTGTAQRMSGKPYLALWQYTLIKRTMSPVQPIGKGTRDASRGWVWRMMFGLALIGLSLRGIGFCQQLFRTYMAGPGPTPLDTSFAALAGWAAWFVFFGPIGVAGLIVLFSVLRKLGALDRLGQFCEKWMARKMPSAGKPQSSGSFRSEEASHDGLESLGDEKVAQLTKRAHRIAVLLGLSGGLFFVLVGIFGLIFATQAMPLRLTIDFAVLSGISILAGLAILQRTLRKENNAWLLPLKLFTQRVLKLHSRSVDSHRTIRSEHDR